MFCNDELIKGNPWNFCLKITSIIKKLKKFWSIKFYCDNHGCVWICSGNRFILCLSWSQWQLSLFIVQTFDQIRNTSEQHYISCDNDNFYSTITSNIFNIINSIMRDHKLPIFFVHNINYDILHLLCFFRDLTIQIAMYSYITYNSLNNQIYKQTYWNKYFISNFFITNYCY